MNHSCPHRSGWTPLDGGADRCNACGVERYSSYAPLRPPPDSAPQGPERQDPDAAAALSIAVLGPRLLEARSRLLRRTRRRWAMAA